MAYFKKFFLSLIYMIILTIILVGIVTILYYYDYINNAVYNLLKLTILLVSIFINSFMLGNKALEKGYLEGIKFGIIIIILLLLPTIIMRMFSFKLIIYYVMIISTSCLGSMVGISRKKNT